MRLRDKIAIITGGGKGIGKAISRAFAAEGATVIIAGIEKEMEETAREIQSSGGTADVMETDIISEQQIKRMVSLALRTYNRIDILVNNAGVAGPTANIVDLSIDDWNNVMAVNLTGAMLCAREVLKSMVVAKSGNIINISSEGGRSGFPMRSPYAVSKRGIIALTETMAIEVGEYNIRVNCISPGRVSGQRIIDVSRAKAEALSISYEDVMAKIMEGCSLKRLIEPFEIAAAAVFLASDESSAITGQTLAVNCGKYIVH